MSKPSDLQPPYSPLQGIIMTRTFVGFGFGPIQNALFLYEAHRSGHFDRYVVAEVDQSLVNDLRDNAGAYTINIARKGQTNQAVVPGVELYNPRDPGDREKLIQAIAQANELATALPSVNFFDTGGDSSVAALLADGLYQRSPHRPAVVYAAENHNHAAQILHQAVSRHHAVPENVQFLNTVIGKMSGVITGNDQIAGLGLARLTPASNKAILVEEFNRILVSRITLPGFVRGIDVFVEKDDLLPFEEVKLFGHNAIHAMIGYLARQKGLATMAQAAHEPQIMSAARSAFIDESGAALVRKYAGLGDELFTSAGFQAYADDLLERMVRPNLNDLVSRVTRDPIRKLGLDDRLFGAMRLVLEMGMQPHNLARGAAAAVRMLIDEIAAGTASIPGFEIGVTVAQSVSRLLLSIWGQTSGPQTQALLDCTRRAIEAADRADSVPTLHG